MAAVRYFKYALVCLLAASLWLAVIAASPKGIKLVPTPFGLRPAQCVHRSVGHDVVLKPVADGVEIHHPNKTIVKLPALPECIEWDKHMQSQRMERRSLKLQQVFKDKNDSLPAPLDGWLDNAGYYPPGFVLDFSGYYLVPTNPPNDGSQVLFYFIGTENFQSGVGVTILQPVLTWGNGINGWSVASWNCCPSGQSHESNPLVGFGSGSTLYGLIDKSGDTWGVTSQWGSQQTTLNVANNGRTFDWTDVTLETYSVASCNEFATGPMVFSGLTMTLTDGSHPTPQWSPTGPTECGGKLTVNNPTNIVIQHS